MEKTLVGLGAENMDYSKKLKLAVFIL